MLVLRERNSVFVGETAADQALREYRFKGPGWITVT